MTKGQRDIKKVHDEIERLEKERKQNKNNGLDTAPQDAQLNAYNTMLEALERIHNIK